MPMLRFPSATSKRDLKLCSLVIFVYIYFPWFGAVAWTYNTFCLHYIKQARGSGVADAQSSLEKRSRSLFCLFNHINRLTQQVVLVIAVLKLVKYCPGSVLRHRFFDSANRDMIYLRLVVLSDEFRHGAYFFFAYIGALNAPGL